MHLPTLAVVAALAACAVPEAALCREVPARWRGHTIELLDETGRVLPTFQHRGRTYVLGAAGQRYLLRVRNGSAARIEVVASVDGRDVVDGRAASFEKRGYIVEPHGELTIDGYRLSEASVAAFRFGTVERSYAARSGDARDVGVIGVALFAERTPVARALPYPSAEPPAQGERGAPPPAGDRGAPERGKAPEAAPHARAEPDGRSARPGLGTEFGEEHDSRVVRVTFERARPRPDAVLTVRYDDRAGLVAAGVDVDPRPPRDERWLRATAEPFRSEGFCEPPPGWTR